MDLLRPTTYEHAMQCDWALQFFVVVVVVSKLNGGQGKKAIININR